MTNFIINTAIHHWYYGCVCGEEFNEVIFSYIEKLYDAIEDVLIILYVQNFEQ